VTTGSQVLEHPGAEKNLEQLGGFEKIPFILYSPKPQDRLVPTGLISSFQ